MSLNAVWWLNDVRWWLNIFNNWRGLRRSEMPIIPTTADNRAPTCQIRKSVINVSEAARLRANRTRKFIIFRRPETTLTDNLLRRAHKLTTLECLCPELLVRDLNHQVCQFG